MHHPSPYKKSKRQILILDSISLLLFSSRFGIGTRTPYWEHYLCKSFELKIVLPQCMNLVSPSPINTHPPTVDQLRKVYKQSVTIRDQEILAPICKCKLANLRLGSKFHFTLKLLFGRSPYVVESNCMKKKSIFFFFFETVAVSLGSCFNLSSFSKAVYM